MEIRRAGSGRHVLPRGSGSAGRPDPDLPAGRPGGRPASSGVPKAVIAPHAGYVYSGRDRGPSAYARIVPLRAHGSSGSCCSVPCPPACRSTGLAADPTPTPSRPPLGAGPGRQGRQSPRGAHPARRSVRSIAATPGEHSLEVHIPFLQVAPRRVSRWCRLVVGATPRRPRSGKSWTACGARDETLIVISSDLSHYSWTTRACQRLDAGHRVGDRAPGRDGARPRPGLRAHPHLGPAAHGAPTGIERGHPRCPQFRRYRRPRATRVVGYGSWLFIEKPARAALDEDAFGSRTPRVARPATAPDPAAAWRRRLDRARAGRPAGRCRSPSTSMRAPTCAEKGAAFVTPQDRGPAARAASGTFIAHRPLAVDRGARMRSPRRSRDPPLQAPDARGGSPRGRSLDFGPQSAPGDAFPGRSRPARPAPPAARRPDHRGRRTAGPVPARGLGSSFPSPSVFPGATSS